MTSLNSGRRRRRERRASDQRGMNLLEIFERSGHARPLDAIKVGANLSFSLSISRKSERKVWYDFDVSVARHTIACYGTMVGVG